MNSQDGIRFSIVVPLYNEAASLTALAERLQLSELVVNTWTFDPAARHRSYELLAAAFGLGR